MSNSLKSYFRIIGSCYPSNKKDGFPTSINDNYLRLSDDCEFSIQLGNLGYSYEMLQHINCRKHRIMGGVNDNYHTIYSHPHCLPDYGMYSIPNIKFFFLRGGLNNHLEDLKNKHNIGNNYDGRQQQLGMEELQYLQLRNA